MAKFDGIGVCVHIDDDTEIDAFETLSNQSFALQISGDGYSNVVVFASKEKMQRIADVITHALIDADMMQKEREVTPCDTNA